MCLPWHMMMLDSEYVCIIFVIVDLIWHQEGRDSAAEPNDIGAARSSDTRVITSAYQAGESARATRVSSVTRPEGLVIFDHP